MKVIQIFLVLAFITGFSSVYVNAQKLNKASTLDQKNAPIWVKKMYGDNPNVFEVDELYRAYYTHHNFEKN